MVSVQIEYWSISGIANITNFEAGPQAIIDTGLNNMLNVVVLHGINKRARSMISDWNREFVSKYFTLGHY